MDQEEAWREFADQVDGCVETEESGRWFFKGRKNCVVAPVGRWSLTLDTFEKPRSQSSSTTYTRMTAPYDSLDCFRFKVYQAKLFSRLRRRLGAQDIKVGDPEFDSEFMVEGNDTNQVQRLLASAQLRQAVRRALSKGHLLAAGQIEIKERGRLYFEQMGTIEESGHLLDVHKLFAETLNRLHKVGSASK